MVVIGIQALDMDLRNSNVVVIFIFSQSSRLACENILKSRSVGSGDVIIALVL